MTVTPITWNQQSRYLWTGRRAGYPLATIERGRRFELIDLAGRRASVHRTLQQAQDAAAELPAAAGL